MKRLSRRRFLAQSGASLAGLALAGPLIDGLVPSAHAAPAAADGFPGPMFDTLSSIVRDLEKKFPYASALYTANDGTVIRRDRRGKGVSESQFRTRGTSLRVFDGSAFHETSVGSSSPDALRAAARQLSNEVAVDQQRYVIEPLGQLERSWQTEMKTDPESVPLAERVAHVDQEFDRANWDDPRIRNATVTSNIGRSRRVFVDGRRRLSNDSTMINHSLFLFGLDDGKPGFAFVRRVGQGGLELAALTDELIEKSRKNVVDAFAAEPVKAGVYDVIFAPEVSGLLAHESFGHGVEMDQFVKRRAKAQEFLGKKVATPIVNMMDDPSIVGARGSYPFDDEGVLAKPTTIIKDGVFRQALTDLMSATFMGTARTPNGRTQGWNRKVYARMSNTFFANGESQPEELMADLKDGLYIEGFRNGIEDPHGWGIQFTANMAREVKNGKFTGKIYSPATITGYVPEILSNITMMANDFRMEPGTCGKGFKEFVAVGSGGPHLRTKARVS